MWKIVLIVLFLVAIFGMTAFLFLPDQKLLSRLRPAGVTSIPTQVPVPSPQSADTDPATLETHEIKDALKNSTTLECHYTDAEGRTVTTYLKDGDVRSNYVAQKADESASTIIKDKVMYVWNLSTKQGYKMVLTSSIAAEGDTAQTTYDVVADLEKYKQFCKSATVANDLFIPPADVTLEDYSYQSPVENAEQQEQ